MPITIIPISSSSEVAVVNVNASKTTPALINFTSSKIQIAVYSNSSSETSLDITLENVSASLLLPPGSAVVSAVNISSMQNLSRVEMIIHYPCTISSAKIAPYQYRNGIWSKVNNYTVNSTSCTVSLSTSGNGIVALLSGNINQAPLNPYLVYATLLIAGAIVGVAAYIIKLRLSRSKATSKSR